MPSACHLLHNWTFYIFLVALLWTTQRNFNKLTTQRDQTATQRTQAATQGNQATTLWKCSRPLGGSVGMGKKTPNISGVIAQLFIRPRDMTRDSLCRLMYVIGFN